jgi:tRNA dimethylallyltransferase
MEPRSKNHKIIVILGPTSSGKSAVAIKLARKFNGEIISADSRQIYRGMDVGTGKVPKSKDKSQRLKVKLKNKKSDIYWSEGIPHYLIDIVNPKTDYNVANFKKDAEKAIQYILERGKLPIICGGTGFWIKAVVDNLNFPKVKPDKVLRNMLRNKPASELFKLLMKLDSKRGRTIDAKNKIRLIRAIEICQKLGKVPQIKPARDSKSREHRFLQIGIDVSREVLSEKIKKRLKKRFQAGMIEEVRKLRKLGLSWKRIQGFGLGYFWIPLYLEKKISLQDLRERVYLAEKDYAKRQMTWFRKDKRIMWFKNYKEIEKETKKFLS